jgi:small nuclear ribonucleoprotein (snRNP)-like protein
MSRKGILVIICAMLLWQAFSFFSEVEAQAQDRLVQRESLWDQLWNWLKEHTFAFSIITVTFITIFSTVMAMLRKDKLLRSLAGQLVTIELKGNQPGHDGERHRGRLRVESEGLEVVEERANKSNEKVSYLHPKHPKDGYKDVHAIIRYHDFLTDREKEERKEEVRQVYHPSIGMRLRRRIRNVINEMRRVATEAFTLTFGKVKEQFTVGSRQYGTELEKAGQEAVGYVTEATYDALIDRLIGTRVVVHIKPKLEYVGVLKDYTSQFIQLLDAKYKNVWKITVEKKKDYSKNERGLTLQRDGNDVIIQSKSPFRVKLKRIDWTDGNAADAKRENINKTIEPFGQLRFSLTTPAKDTVVRPFEKLQLPLQFSHTRYKKIHFSFESVRVADVVLLKNYGLVRHRTEKYEARLLDFGALADALLTSRGEELVLEGNPSTTPLTIYNGYLTNLPRERMDFGEVDGQCSQRWTVESFFNVLDKKLRPVSNHYFLGFLPLRKPRKVLALLALTVMIHSDEKRKKDPLLPFIYFALCNANSRKRRRLHKNRVVIKKKKRLFGFLPRPSQV